jgi:hypothetical protein
MPVFLCRFVVALDQARHLLPFLWSVRKKLRFYSSPGPPIITSVSQRKQQQQPQQRKQQQKNWGQKLP